MSVFFEFSSTAKETTLVFYHVHDFEVSIGESDSVWGGCHWQHECQGRADGTWQHNVKRMQANVASLGIDNT